MIDGTELASQVTPRALSALVTLDDLPAHSLLEQRYIADRRRHYRRTGFRMSDDSRLGLRLRREWNGAWPDSAAERHYGSEEQRQRILGIESGLVRDDGELEALEATYEAMGEEATSRALSRRRDRVRIPEHCRNAATLPDCVRLLAEGLKSYQALSERQRESASEPTYRLSEPRLRRLTESKDCIPLPQLEDLLDSCGLPLTDALQRDWYEQWPRLLLAEGGEAPPHVLTRLLHTVIHAKELSIRQFCEMRLPDVQPNTLSTAIQEIDHDKMIDWRYASAILSAGEIGDDAPAFVFARALHRRMSVADALQSARQALRRSGADIHPEHLPGATLEELGIAPPEESA